MWFIPSVVDSDKATSKGRVAYVDSTLVGYSHSLVVTGSDSQNSSDENASLLVLARQFITAML
ncbi:hypothetical protein A2U01_0034255, partial [Trifolium medium]|nr:hypothetical protein [Trifolium medium]